MSIGVGRNSRDARKASAWCGQRRSSSASAAVSSGVATRAHCAGAGAAADVGRPPRRCRSTTKMRPPMPADTHMPLPSLHMLGTLATYWHSGLFMSF